MYEEYTYETIKAEMLEKITLTDKREGSFANDQVSSSALQGEKVWAALRRVISIFFLEDCTGVYLERFAAEREIYRKEGTKAHGEVTFTGEAGVEIPAGTLCSTINGLMFITTELGTIGIDGTVTLPVEAEAVGDKYNILAGYITTMPVAIMDVTGVTNAEKFIGGTEVETDTELLARYLLVLRTPATSGNPYHYMQWALEVEGVGNVRVFPLDNGPGTVGVMPITSSGRAVDEDMIEAVIANIEEKRPIGATVSVYAPAEVMVTVTAEIEITSAVILADVLATYRAMFEAYIKDSVFKLQTVDYYKCLSMFYDIPGVSTVRTFLLNDGTENITVGNKEIQVAGDVSITEVTAE